MPGILSDDPNSGMPGFNILGMILGGRGYAANYFGQRDQAHMDEFKRGQREQFASGLMASPEYKEAIAAPYDRNKQFGLWGQFYGQPGGDVNMGNQLLSTSISSIYGREKSLFDEEIWKKNLNLSAESQLMVDQKIRDRDAQGKKDAMSLLLTPNPETGENSLLVQAKRNQAYDLNFPGQRGNNDIVPTPNGLAMQPAPGSEDFRKMTGEMQSGQNIVSGLANLTEMAKEGTGSKAAWDSERTLLQLEAKKLFDLGALDKDSIETLNNLVPGYNDNWSVNPQAMGGQTEKLRVATERMKSKLAQTADRWRTPLSVIPNRANAVQAPGSPTKPMPSGPAVIPQMPPRAPASRDTRPKPAAIQPPGLLESPGGRQYDPKTGGRAGRYGG